jgi:hypothetical protein
MEYVKGGGGGVFNSEWWVSIVITYFKFGKCSIDAKVIMQLNLICNI